MFGRRRHAAVTPPAPVPQLTDEQVFEHVHAVLDRLLGEHGTWTVARRDGSESDALFHRLLAHSVSQDVTAALSEARARLAASERVALHLAGEGAGLPDAAGPEDEPAALAWQPAPITRWADLKRPVTGEVAVPPPSLVA